MKDLKNCLYISSNLSSLFDPKRAITEIQIVIRMAIFIFVFMKFQSRRTKGRHEMQKGDGRQNAKRRSAREKERGGNKVSTAKIAQRGQTGIPKTDQVQMLSVVLNAAAWRSQSTLGYPVSGKSFDVKQEVGTDPVRSHTLESQGLKRSTSHACVSSMLTSYVPSLPSLHFFICLKKRYFMPHYVS